MVLQSPIPYGRGAVAIARQVLGETGGTANFATLVEEIKTMTDAWKTRTYPVAWSYMQACAAEVLDPGYIITPWGRKRIFPPAREQDVVAAMQREAQNFPIQSTVADTCMIAMQLIVEYRQQHNLQFKIVNQIHDAIMLEVPEDEIEQVTIMFKETMGDIEIPIPERPLTLDIGIEILTRWGEKRKTHGTK